MTGTTVVTHLKPGQRLAWDTFRETTPARSIAFGDVVRGIPRHDLKSLHFSFGLQETLPSVTQMYGCMQTYLALKSGLMEHLRGQLVSVYVNRLTPDNVLAMWLLKHHHLFEATMEPGHMRRLIELTQDLTASDGQQPLGLHRYVFGIYAWVFAPLTGGGEQTHAMLEETYKRLDTFYATKKAGGAVDLAAPSDLGFPSALWRKMAGVDDISKHLSKKTGRPTFEIKILPRVNAWTREQFRREAGPYAIAIDNFVADIPYIEFDEATGGLILNVDHHEGTVRLGTLSASMQIYILIRCGLMAFLYGQHVTLWIRDIDQDTAFAIWALLNYEVVEQEENYSGLRQVFELNNAQDILTGCYPLDLNTALVRYYAEIGLPYNEMRTKGLLWEEFIGEAEYRTVLYEMLNRITAYVNGTGKMATLAQGRLPVIREHPCMPVFDLSGLDVNAQWRIFQRGVRNFISFNSKRTVFEGAPYVADYSIGTTPFSGIELFPLAERLTLAEPEPDLCGWRGASTRIGSNRLHGSRLTLASVCDIAHAYIARP